MLIVGNPGEVHVGRHLRRAAESLGIEVELIDVAAAWGGPAVVRRALWAWDRRPYHLRRFGRQVIDRCNRLAPTLVIVTGIAPPDAGGLRELANRGIPVVNFLTDDPFNPAQAIFKAAWYLRYLTDMTGNIGLAAIAYNGGEARAARFIASETVLPYETQDYVEAITGFNAWRWRDNPPETADLKLALDPDRPFRPACESLAGNRGLREFVVEPRVFPWGVIVASHRSRAVAQGQVARLNRTLRPLLDGRRVGYVRKRLSGIAQPVYTAQIGYESRGEAYAFCIRLKRLGGNCIVLKN
ncbi:MAG: lytic transglycosylase domain-containing protein [Gemmataceae bacterium]